MADVRDRLPPRRRRRAVLLYLVILAALVGAFSFAVSEMAYTWHWEAVPGYFFHDAKVTTRAEVRGEVSITIAGGGMAEVAIRGEEGEREEMRLPAGALRVADGQYVYRGDVLAEVVRRWQPGLLLIGLRVTLEVSLLAILLGTVLGLVAGLARISRNLTLRWWAVTYIELVRGSPLLVQIFIWYYVLGTLANNLLTPHGLGPVPPFWFGVASLAVFAGAYVAEIVRAGIESIHRGQMEAARSLGMTYAQAMRHVILPQALRRILPPLAGQFISLVKDSSLLGVIAIRELTKATREAVTTDLHTFELWFVCALLYLVLTGSLSLVVRWLEGRTR